MLGSIYVGLSGMDAYSRGLQTISNNVSNLNSPGFKSTKVSFLDISGQGDHGGVFAGTQNGNGHGVKVADPVTDYEQGELRQTNNDLDLGIDGGGLFTLLDKNDKLYFTRTGSFSVDKEGFVSEQTSGYRLAILDSSGQPIAVNLNNRQTSAPVATTKISFTNNLSSSGTTATVSNIVVYDNRGGQQVWTATFNKSTAPGAGVNQWDVVIKDALGSTMGSGSLNFIGGTPDASTTQIVINATPTGADPLSVKFDFSNVTSYSSGTSSTLNALAGDGVGVGTLTSVTVDQDGQLKLSYSNQKTELLGPVAIADIQNQQQLLQVGGGLYRGTDSAAVRLTSSGTEHVGTIKSRSIEASNVNLSAEFGDLILIQRGFQACSQVVSVTNDMIQQLFSTRGQ